MIKNAPDVMTVKEVMKVLRCGRTKIMEFIHNGVLEAHYVCGKIRYLTVVVVSLQAGIF